MEEKNQHLLTRGEMIFLGLLIVVVFVAYLWPRPDTDGPGRAFSREANIHYTSVALGWTRYRNDRELHETIADYRAVTSNNVVALLDRVDLAATAVKDRRHCDAETTVPECRRYFEAMEPFIQR